MTARALNTVAIVGRDADLWLTACTLHRALAPAGVAVAAVELPSAAGPADLLVAHPALEALHDRIGIDEAAMLRLCGGAWTLGRNFAEPGGAEPPFLIAHGAYGAPVDGGAFFPLWLKARRFGLAVALEEFSPTAVAARHGRLLIPDDRSAAFGRSDYGYHLPAAAYAEMLRDVAVRLGVRVVTGAGLAVECGDGAIAAVAAGGERVTADLFIDASGPEAILAGSPDGGDRVDWSAMFPVDRLMLAVAPRLRSVPVYADVRAGAGGWTALFPAMAGTWLLHAFSSAESGDEAAMRDAATLSGLPLDAVVFRSLQPGRARAAWRGNCLAVGGAAAVFDPVHGVDLHALQLALVRLLGCFPPTTDFAAERASFNAATAEANDRIADFQAAHYRLARYAGRFWDRARAQSPSAPLAHRIATFAARGEIAPWEEDGFPDDAWRALFTGHGVVPDSWPPATDRVPPETMKAGFRDLLARVRDEVLRQPLHDDQLARIARPSAGPR